MSKAKLMSFMMTENYKLSVITICYNAEDYIVSTFESIRKQNNTSFEYIVIDGGSDDGTIEMIKSNLDIIDYWCSETDQGISDALNKGVSLSQGEYIVFLHADDYFVDENSTDRALVSIKQGADLIAFDIYVETQKGRFRNSPRGFNYYTNFKMPFYHPGVLCKRSLFKKLGGFDLSFKIAMDYDFFLRAYVANVTFTVEGDVLTVFRDTGISSRQDWLSLKERFAEERRAHYKNCKHQSQFFIYRFWWVLYPLYRKVRYYFS